MGDYSANQKQPGNPLSRTGVAHTKVDEMQATALEDWAAVFLLVQQLEKAAGYDGPPLFHDELGQQPTVIPGRVTIWPAELKPLWHVTRQADPGRRRPIAGRPTRTSLPRRDIHQDEGRFLSLLLIPPSADYNDSARR